MLLTVPFYTQGRNECGPVTLQMVLEYFGEKHKKEAIKKLVDSESTGTTWTIGLAKTAAQLGFPTEFYSTSLGFNPKNFELEHYQRETDGAHLAKEKLERLKQECLKYGVKLEERSISFQEIISKMNNDCIPIILLDWSKVKKQGTFKGHFVPIVGYDDKGIIIHQPGPMNPEPNYKIDHQTFEEARKARGTDEDIIFIFRKRE